MITKLEYYDSECQRLKEMTSLLELSLWKARISSLDHGIMAMSGGNTKIKRDNMEFKLQCRISCGADHVIQNVLPFLLPPNFVRSYVYVDKDDNNFDIDSDSDSDSDDDIIEGNEDDYDEVEGDSEDDDNGSFGNSKDD
jgi:hypothetical protein